MHAQASILSEFPDPFPIREFMDLHMLVSCLAGPALPPTPAPRSTAVSNGA